MRLVKLKVLLFLVALASGCSAEEPRATAPADAAAVETVARTAAVRFVQRSPSAPSFADEEIRLAATAGAAGEITLRFTDGSPFATFRTGEETLRGARLQGRPIPAGDTVWITMRRVDGSRFLVELEPSGLVFNPQAPAELVFHHRHSSYPVDQEASFWKQERVDSPWERIEARHDQASRTFRAPLEGFTKYALATGY
jgi:hypothetical protein